MTLEEIKKLIKQVDINQPFINKFGLLSTYLSEAIETEDVKMVEVLLKNGANPNLICDGENVLWSLQYTQYPHPEFSVSDMADESDENRLTIAQLLLEYGANPNIVLVEESLFSYVYYAVYQDDDFGRSLAYRGRFLILLIAYGGGESWLMPKIKKPFDKSRMKDYRLDGFSVRDKNGDVIVEI